MSQPPLFALIDCNNFFVSCERLFRPDLEGKPVVVLSSNDGCAVSRSAEAKAIGIPMGCPAFKLKDFEARAMHLSAKPVFSPSSAASRTDSTVREQQRRKTGLVPKYTGQSPGSARSQTSVVHEGVTKFSANFELYGNISRRITALLTSITPNIEIYSIDESFLDLSSLPITDYEAWGKEIRQRILDWVGIPVSIGIAPTKTLAKLANLQAKKRPELGGVFVSQNHDQQATLKAVQVQDIWGVGWRLAPRLRAEGVRTAFDVYKLEPRRAQQLMGVRGRQLVAELSGVQCYHLEREGKLPQSIASTRTFGADTNDIHAIEAAFASFAATASYKLRRSSQLTQKVALFITTSRHKPGYRSWQQQISFSQPTADPGKIMNAVMAVLYQLHQPGAQYHRAGITLYDFVPDAQLQTDLLGLVDVTQYDTAKRRLKAFDSLNNRYGKRTVRFAAEMLDRGWRPKYLLRSPRFVSRWDELPKIHPLY